MNRESTDTIPRLHGWQLFLATLAVSLGTLLISLDQFIANVSIPTISGELGVSQDDGTWVITSYTVASAVTIPLTGWFTASLGRTRLFSISAILFGAMSLLCGLANSFPTLLIFRVFQGLVSGSLIPLSQALLLFLFPTKRGFAMGMWGLVVMVGPALGPVLGGWITDNMTWRWIFNINVPLGLFAGILAYVLLAKYDDARKKIPADGIGIALLVVAVGAYQVMLDRGNDADWFHSNFIRGLAILSFAAFTFFFVWERFHPYPVVELSFFKSRNFTLGSLVIGISMMLVFGSLIVGPIWVQAQLGYTPLWAGYSIAPFGLSALIIFPLIGIYLHLINVRLWIVIGFILIIPTYLYLAYLPITTPFANLAWPRLWQGAGFAFFYVPLTTISLAGISESKMPSAAGIFSFTRMLFMSAGVTLSTTFFSRRENFFQSRYVESVIPSNPQYEIYYQALLEKLDLVGLYADAFINRMVMDQAYTQAFLELNYLSGWGFICMFLAVFFFRSDKDAKKGAFKREL